MLHKNKTAKTRVFASIRAAVMVTASVIVLAAMLSACKQGNGQGGGGNTPKPEPQKVIITVTGDNNIIVKEPKTLEVPKGSKWSAVKAKVEAKLSYNTGYEPAGFKLGSASGVYLSSSHVFNKSSTVFAVSKQNGAPEPETITITVKGDEGVTATSENTFKADKNAEWKNIKASAMGKITVKENYELAEWRLNDKTGELLTDTKTFAANATVFAVTKKKITITFKGDENVQSISQDSLITYKGTKWENIKSKIKITHKETGFIAIFKLNAINGNVLEDDYTFIDDTVVFVSSELLFKTDGQGTITGFLCEKYELPENIVFPAKIKDEIITAIGQGAFENCTVFKNIDIANCENLSLIEHNALSGCINAVIKLPKSISNIKNTSLGIADESYCKKVIVPNVEVMEKVLGSGYPKDRIELTGRFEENGFYYTDSTKTILIGCSDTVSGEIKIPASVTTVAVQAFFKNIKITGIDFSDCINLTTISEKAFYGCRELKSINFSDCTNLTTIDIWAFFGCISLTNADISSCTNLNTIGIWAFANCTNAVIRLSANIKEIGQWTFDKCKKVIVPNVEVMEKVLASGYPKDRIELTGRFEENGFYYTDSTKTILIGCSDTISGEIKIPASVIEIAVQAFKFNIKITGADFSDCINLTTIGSQAFTYCKLANTNLSSCTKLAVIDSKAFDGCKEAIIALPVSITEIGREALGKMNGYCKKVIVPNVEVMEKVLASGYPKDRIELTGRFEENGFYYTDSTKTILVGCSDTVSGEIKIPASVTTVAVQAFFKNIKITGIDFSDCINLTTIGEKAFYGCRALKSLELPASLSEIGREAFFECLNLIKLSVDVGNTHFCAEGNILYDKEKTKVIFATPLIQTVTLPVTVTEIGESAFFRCRKLESVDLSNCIKLTKIDERAFSGCISAEVKLPESIKEIGQEAFGIYNWICQKVLIKSGSSFYKIKKLVIESHYPENRIEEY